MSAIIWNNYFVRSLMAKGNEGHILASDLLETIVNHDGSEAYHSLFDMDRRENFNSYLGPAKSALGYIWFDFDSKDEGVSSYADLKKCLEWLSISLDELLIFWSGRKGFTLGVPAKYFPFPEIADNLGKLVGNLAQRLKSAFPTLDAGIYNTNRKIRVMSTKHPISSLYKTQLKDLDKTLEQIKEYAKTKQSLDIKPAMYVEGKALPHITKQLEMVNSIVHHDVSPSDSDRKSQFSSYKNKICIKVLFNDRCETGSRHNTALIIVSDFYHTGTHIDECTSKMRVWAEKNGLYAEGRWSEIETQIQKIYSKAEAYTFGCKNPQKAENCSGKCALYRQLKAETRPKVLDAPKYLTKNDDRILQTKIVEQMIAKMGPAIIKQDGDLYRWDNTHWKLLSLDEEDNLKVVIKSLAGQDVTMSQIKQTFDMFKIEVTTISERYKLSAPNPSCANFTNGTLHLKRDLTSGKYSSEFSNHKKEDYLTWCLPVEYPNDRTTKNFRFEKLLKEAFADDLDQDEKTRAIRQTFGAMLIAAFPQLIFFHGVSGSRKSTIAKVPCRVLSNKNMSFVDPTQMEGFMLEGMIGKLVNVCTDIQDHIPLDRGFIKRLEDNMPAQINRKNRRVVDARLPAVHLFCANTLPPNFERASKAMQRRVLLIEFSKDLTNGNRADEIKNYDEIIYNESPEGIVNFMLDGLDDLIANGGKFIVPVSSLKTLNDWQMKSDPVAMFLDDLKVGLVADSGNCINMSLKGKISRSYLFDLFCAWGEKTKTRIVNIHQKAFYSAMRNHGFTDYEGHEGYLFCGIEGRRKDGGTYLGF